MSTQKEVQQQIKVAIYVSLRQQDINLTCAPGNGDSIDEVLDKVSEKVYDQIWEYIKDFD